jgi:hypothetical protein
MDEHVASQLLEFMDRLHWDHGGLTTSPTDREGIQREAHWLLSSMLHGVVELNFLLTPLEYDEDDDDEEDDEDPCGLTSEERWHFDVLASLHELI